MPIVVDIANAALNACGSDDVLVTLDDANKSGRLCKQNYDFARRAVLAKHPWKFANKRVILNRDTSDTPAFGFAYRFLLPENYIRAICVNDRYEQWEREGRYILCNDSDTINLKYTSDEQDVAIFDPLFLDAVALDLALRIVYPLSQSNDRVPTIAQLYKDTIRKARFSDSFDKSMSQIQADLYDDSRLVGGVSTWPPNTVV